jgi:hypothetical protein
MFDASTNQTIEGPKKFPYFAEAAACSRRQRFIASDSWAGFSALKGALMARSTGSETEAGTS